MTKIISLSEEYIPACVQIARHAPDPWKQDAFENVVKDAYREGFLLLQGEEPVGFACFLVIAGSADLELVAVAPEHRGKGFAGNLLQHAFSALAAKDVGRCLLEVRAGNASALSLYKKLGFQKLVDRPGMYANPAEDGILLSLSLCEFGSS